MLTQFLKNCRGGVAPMLAMAAIPLMGAVGVAVDYTRANATRTAFQAALDSTALTLSKTAATDSANNLQTTASNYLQRLVHPPRSQERYDYRHLFFEQRVACDAQRQRHHRHEFSQNAWLQPDRHYSFDDIDLGQHPAAGRARARQYRIDVAKRQDDRAEDRVAKSSHPAQGRGRARWRRLCVDHPVQQGRECRRVELQSILDRLERLERRQRHLQQYELSQRKAVARRTTRSGRPTTTAPGTAASPTATRISIPPTMRRLPAARCIRPSSILPARFS